MKNYSRILCIVALLLVPAGALAQSYSIDWYKVAGGGAMNTTGGIYSVSGTVGQPEAGPTMIGGVYAMTGGFWAIYAVQTAGAPLLTITLVGNQVVVSWPTGYTGWTLQTNTVLRSPNWGNYLGTVVNNSVTNKPPPSDLFFRLHK
jgi:hypothetical protein